jgi:hypothetical protein
MMTEVSLARHQSTLPARHHSMVLSSGCWHSTTEQATQLGSTQLSLDQLNSTWINSTQLGSTQLDLVSQQQLNNSMQLNNSTWMDG